MRKLLFLNKLLSELLLLNDIVSDEATSFFRGVEKESGLGLVAYQRIAAESPTVNFLAERIEGGCVT